MLCSYIAMWFFFLPKNDKFVIVETSVKLHYCF